MTAARKLAPRRECWESQPVPRTYSLGDISRREREPAMSQDCPRCGSLLPQQLVQRVGKGGETWIVLPCTRCPLELGVRR